MNTFLMLNIRDDCDTGITSIRKTHRRSERAWTKPNRRPYKLDRDEKAVKLQMLATASCSRTLALDVNVLVKCPKNRQRRGG